MSAGVDMDDLRARLASADGAVQQEARAELDALLAGSRDRLFAMCYRYVRDEQRAEELVQDAMLMAYERLDDFRGASRFDTWVTGIALNLARNAVRKKRDTLTTDGVLDDTEEGMGALAAMQWQEREQVLREVAERVLSPMEREAVALRYVEQLPQESITELLGLDEKTGARGVLQRCRRKLARGLRQRLTELGHGSSFVRRLPED